MLILTETLTDCVTNNGLLWNNSITVKTSTPNPS